VVLSGLANVDVRELGLSSLSNAILGELEGVVARVDDVVLAEADDAVLTHLGEVCDDLVVSEEVGEVLVDELVAVAQLVVFSINGTKEAHVGGVVKRYRLGDREALYRRDPHVARQTYLLDGDLAASREAVLGLALEAVLVHHADTHSYNTGDHRVAQGSHQGVATIGCRAFIPFRHLSLGRGLKSAWLGQVEAATSQPHVPGRHGGLR